MKKITVLVFAFIAVTFALKADVGFFNGIITIGIPNVSGTSVALSATTNLIAGDGQVSQRGFVWSTVANPLIGGTSVTATNDGQGSSAGPVTESFSHSLTGLTANQVYYVKAFITNSDGTFYSQEMSFTTVPTLGEWGLIAFGSLVAIVGGIVVWRRVSVA